MKPVFQYLDYRRYLADYYAARKIVDPGFSYQRYADMLGFKAKDFIYRVIKGQKNLSRKRIGTVVKSFRLKKAEADYFKYLVLFCQATNQADKQDAYARMRTVLRKTRRVDFPDLLEHQQLELFSTWYYVVIRSLIEMHGFDGNFEALATAVNPSIRPKQAKEAVVVLERLGLIEQSSNGMYTATCKSLSTGEDVRKHALVPFYQEMIELGKQSLDNIPRNERNISGLTVGISRATYDKITGKIHDFRREIQQLADADDGADQVYELALLLFPLSNDGLGKNRTREK
jgi:uncharacterized protein (TIGR02147 family)